MIEKNSHRIQQSLHWMFKITYNLIIFSLCSSGAYRMCNFESGTLCDWSQDSEDDLEWVWFNGFQGEVDGGPSDDHTYGNPTGKC